MHSTAAPDRIYPRRYQDATIDSYLPLTASTVTAKDEASRMIEGEIRNLVLVGPPGTGKTHLAVAVVRAILDRETEGYRSAVEEAEREPDGDWPRLPVTPIWTNVASLIVSLRLQMDAPLDDRTAADTVRQLRRHAGIAVLDDLGREKVSDWTGEVIYDLVNSRYEERLPTIVTSNLTPTELAASPYWPAISRLAEDGALVRIEAPDHRLGKAS